MTALTLTENKACCGGEQRRYQHQSATNNCLMTFSVFLPPQAKTGKVPAVYWLSGLTCTDENFSTKAGAQHYAAELGLALIIPDTSPRGDDVPDDADAAYDFGLGAGFYVNATEQPWAQHYQMYDYIVHELPALVEAELPLNGKRSISGHSMGGHGALMIGLRNPNLYTAISAFAPIVNPSAVPWGKKAFANYLGADELTWRTYDSVEIIRDSESVNTPILVDQGDADSFLAEQLVTDNLSAALEGKSNSALIRFQPGYDHSFYFILSFIGEHLRFHARALGILA